MTVAELIAELKKMPQDAKVSYGSYYGEEITKIEFYADTNEVEVS